MQLKLTPDLFTHISDTRSALYLSKYHKMYKEMRKHMDWIYETGSKYGGGVRYSLKFTRSMSQFNPGEMGWS